MNQYRPNELLAERLELERRAKEGLLTPKEVRRIDEIASLLITDGKSDQVTFSGRPRNVNRVTSFTKDRR